MTNNRLCKQCRSNEIIAASAEGAPPNTCLGCGACLTCGYYISPRMATEHVCNMAQPISARTAEVEDYKRAVIIGTAAKWLGAHLAIRKVELLKEKRDYLRTRGSDTTRFENLLADIERDVDMINHIQDALS
jgi:hypothetical protein